MKTLKLKKIVNEYFRKIYPDRLQNRMPTTLLRFPLPSFILLISLFLAQHAYSLQNNVGAHDPSSIIKCNDTYWIFTTGNGIYSMYSNDMIRWTAGTTPFSGNNWPSWISNYVPGFEGNFWAPECIYMNGRYYLYYSCSTWGVKTSAIGLATNITLDPSSPGYEWIDEGMVVYSNQSSDANCIDPSLFRDGEGNLWLTYGSYFGGIRIAELNTTTGKPVNATRYAVASGNCEASYVIHHGEYYYLFINRGSCCQGTSSTYHIQVGRSSNPTGPFMDKGDHNMNAGYGSTILAASDNFIGPGCLGYFVENNTEWATFHYYDGDNAGAATLAIANMQWDEEAWPVITLEWLEDGIYSIANQSNYYVWESEGCTGTGNEAIVQAYYAYESCQQWNLSSLGNGYYSIKSPISNLGVELSNCESSTGTPLVMGSYADEDCEIWRIERTNWGSYTIASKAGNRVATLTVENNTEGTPVKIASYLGTNTQKWVLSDTSENITPVRDNIAIEEGFEIYPNPSSERSFRIELTERFRDYPAEIVLIASDGRIMDRVYLDSSEEIIKLRALTPGIYWICIDGTSYRKKLLLL